MFVIQSIHVLLQNNFSKKRFNLNKYIIMEVINNTIEVLKGEQFERLIKGIDYDACSQIILLLYKESNPVVKMVWVKVDTADYPAAPKLVKSTDLTYPIKIWVSEDVTKKLETGSYLLEAKTVVDGVDKPIVKAKKYFFTIKESQTV